jgi:hypothetical protein
LNRPKEEFIQDELDSCYYFYQASNGENMFLHPLCKQILDRAFPPVSDLLKENSGSQNGRQTEGASEELKSLQDTELSTQEAQPTCALPLVLEEMPILEIEHHIAEDTKVFSSKEFKKLKYLHHLPPGVQYGLVEVDLSSIVSPEVMQQFHGPLQKRAKERRIRDNKEVQYSKKVESLNEEKHELYKKESI